VIDEDAAHQPRRHSKEVSFILKVPLSLLNQTQPRLVDQGRRLQRVIDALPAHKGAREAAEFIVKETYEWLRGFRIASVKPVEQLRDFALRRRHK